MLSEKYVDRTLGEVEQLQNVVWKVCWSEYWMTKTNYKMFLKDMLVGTSDSIDQLQNVFGKNHVRFSDARIFFQLTCIAFCSHVCSNYFSIWSSLCCDFVGTCARHFVVPGCMHCVLYLWKCFAQLLPLYLNGDQRPMFLCTILQPVRRPRAGNRKGILSELMRWFI